MWLWSEGRGPPCKRNWSSVEDGTRTQTVDRDLAQSGEMKWPKRMLPRRTIEGRNQHPDTSSNCPKCFSSKYWSAQTGRVPLSGLLLRLCEWVHCFIGISGLFFSLETMSLMASDSLALNSWSQGWPKLLFLLPPSPEGWVEVCTTTPSFMWSNKATFPKLSVFRPIYYLFLYAFIYFHK